MALLILVRHGESVWNTSGRLAGRTDVLLSEAGKEQAKQAGRKLRSFDIDSAYISELRRTAETLDEIKNQRNKKTFPTQKHPALNERDFGTLTGRLKDDIAIEIGTDAYLAIFKGWDASAPGGESLKLVYNRVVPYFKNVVLKDLQAGKNVLVVSHHHTLRALVKYIETIADSEAVHIKLGNAEIVIYDFDAQNKVFSKRLPN